MIWQLSDRWEMKSEWNFFINYKVIRIFFFFHLRAQAIQSLQSILKQFDKEVTDRTLELKNLKDDLDEQKRNFAEWKETVYEPQEAL